MSETIANDGLRWIAPVAPIGTATGHSPPAVGVHGRGALARYSSALRGGRPKRRTKYQIHKSNEEYDEVSDPENIPATESYFTGNFARLRRYTLRIDGFVSAHAKHADGELVTKPFVFDGKKLSLNFATSTVGLVRIELQDENGKPVPGFMLADSDLFYGDSLDRIESWKGNKDVSTLAGKPIRMSFVMSEADVYSWKFEE